MTRDMVASYVETLIESVTRSEKAEQDDDGDYPVRFRNALYYVRIAGTDSKPIVRVFSTAVAGVDPTPELFEVLNEVNSRLVFCRCFWAHGQVVIESEHLGMTITTDDFAQLAEHVGAASDHFGPQLAATFGGRLALFESDGDECLEIARPGLYL